VRAGEVHAGMSIDNAKTDEIRVALGRDARLAHPAEVAVAARADTVTLRGTVDSVRQVRAAVETAKSVPGVRSVANELRVDPRNRRPDNETRGAALQALISSPVAPDERIDVSVADGWLTLTGVVAHQDESDAAFDAVRRLSGVGGITNKIEVITAGMDG
jgi:osmotically-inducible protein OsmY